MALLPWFRMLHLSATVLVGGAFAFQVLILRRSGPPARDPAVAATVDRWLVRQCAWGIAVGLVSWVGWLAEIAVNMSGLPASQALAPGMLGIVIARTAFGHVWLLRLALFIVLGGTLLMRGARTSRAGAAFSFAAVLVVVGSLAWTGHALGTSRVHAWTDAAHLLAATVWLGMLPLLWLVTGHALARRGSWRNLAMASARHFFLPGALAVLVLVSSGVVNTSWMVDSVSDLVATEYGRILSLKLALFAAMLLLAAINRLVIVPRLDHEAGADRPLRALRASVLAEVLIGAAILGVVAWLGVTPPVAHERPMQQMHGM